MIRKIIKIDEDKCNGCGICVIACHEGAISIIDNKAKLLRDDYCDGLGDCLPTCPENAISFEYREALEFDKAAVEQNIQNNIKSNFDTKNKKNQWPLQIKLIPTSADYFDNAELLVAADCSAFAYIDFHKDYMKNKITIIGCPKLDETDYSEKLSEILKLNKIKSITAVRMEVPCCFGIEKAVKQAKEKSQKDIPCMVEVISIDGKILKRE